MVHIFRSMISIGIMVNEETKTIGPSDELPEALVEEILSQCDDLGDELSGSFKKLHEEKINIRSGLKDLGLLKKDTEIIISPLHPTTCGVDGSYAINKLLSTDIVGIAGVAVEGLTPPTEKRYWQKPHHLCNISAIQHNDATTVVTRAVMMTMELELGFKAPHDVIFLDGSLTTPFIYFNQALNKASEAPEKLSSLLMEKLEIAFQSYKEILASKRTDKIFAGIPKYTSRREISSKLGLECGDRGLLSLILDAGEFIRPIQLEEPQQPWHIDKPPWELKKIIDEVKSLLYELHVIYYRPYDHFPTLRIEISQSIAKNSQRLGILFESLKLQCGVPGLMEPYPLYLADRMVKHLGTALSAIRETTTQKMLVEWEDHLGNIYLGMHEYRTEWGK